MTEQNNLESAESSPPQAETIPCLIAGGPCGETPSDSGAEVTNDEKGGCDVSH